MFYNPFSRRYFLRGMSFSLALPFLPSIMKNAYGQSSSSPIRYFQIMNAYGINGTHFHTAQTDLLPMSGSGIYAKPLQAISGNYSSIIGSEFNSLKSKISIVRGLHLAPAMTNHNTSLGSCGSGRNPSAENDSEKTEPLFPYSVDSVLAESLKIYPDSVGIQKHVNFCPANIRYNNYSWTKKNGQAQQLPYTSNTAGLLAKFTPLNGQAAPSPSSVPEQNKGAVVQEVYEDYKALRDNPKLGRDDRLRLESYMALINEIQRGIGSVSPSPRCSQPRAESETDSDARTRNQINIAVAAMACQLTRVVALTLSTTYDPVHQDSHDGKETTRTETQKKMAAHVAYAMSQMDLVTEGNGTLLDHSLVYWGNEYGEISGSDPHRVTNMPALIGGGALGAMQMGYYIDYRRTGGIPFNNLLISIFNAMGLGSSDYERDGVVGFGEYHSSLITKYGFEKYTSAAERRKPLPFLYKGIARG